MPSQISDPLEEIARTGRDYCFNCEEFKQHDQEPWKDRREDFGTFEKRVECKDCGERHLKEYSPEDENDVPYFYKLEQQQNNADS
ncbi:hypothetical protein FGG69_gp59 [Salinibacter phage SRUTV-1]|uniref:Uncharacterized protein n=1 Tax=Salinibacter phage SRUTV-1 TaxID=2684227 RepID=A0A2D3FAL2_9CAUD|nr:hypothetical protein FGG69_gp59 [Salinibacter phage SRUTV-1]ATU47048.1 hypothetical protein [Salinibacter phage SRUTV-1]AUO79388.1 hypothetical protein [Salinibacter virus M31CR41-3]